LLLAHASGGDAGVRAFLDHRYLPRVARVCRAYIGDRRVAESVAREVVLTAWECGGLRSERRFVRHLDHTAAAVARDVLRHHPEFLAIRGFRRGRLVAADRRSHPSTGAADDETRAAFFAAWHDLAESERLLARHFLFEDIELTRRGEGRAVLRARAYVMARRLGRGPTRELAFERVREG
jgi:DNA-directed RNA polymerase specialized sigma24 family protein